MVAPARVGLFLLAEKRACGHGRENSLFNLARPAGVLCGRQPVGHGGLSAFLFEVSSAG
jgi:hypothetical protein